MKERPILFSSSMVLAILENRKTQTRRVVNNILHETIESEPDLVDCVLDWDGGPSRLDMMSNGTECCPYGFVGGRLYVRERTRLIEVDDGCSIVSGVGNHKVRLRYEADGTESDWLPYPDRLAALEVGQCVANGCYREAARIWLEVMAVRVQRLQEISGEDALAEGCTDAPGQIILGAGQSRSA